MKYAFFTFDGHGLSIAYHLQNEGYDVIVGQVQDKKDVISEREKEGEFEDKLLKERRLSLYNGILEKMTAERLVEKLELVRNTDDFFLFFDFNNLFKYSMGLENRGFHGNFPTEQDHIFELDRDRAKSFVSSNYNKINTAEVREFNRIEDAMNLIKSSQEMWVIKGNDESAKTFVPDTDDPGLARVQLEGALKTYRKNYGKSGFILEMMIPNVIEITPEKSIIMAFQFTLP